MMKFPGEKNPNLRWIVACRMVMIGHVLLRNESTLESTTDRLTRVLHSQPTAHSCPPQPNPPRQCNVGSRYDAALLPSTTAIQQQHQQIRRRITLRQSTYLVAHCVHGVVVASCTWQPLPRSLSLSLERILFSL
jgi:hypothetical protein